LVIIDAVSGSLGGPIWPEGLLRERCPDDKIKLGQFIIYVGRTPPLWSQPGTSIVFLRLLYSQCVKRSPEDCSSDLVRAIEREKAERLFYAIESNVGYLCGKRMDLFKQYKR
jgi:hypothetical protein